MDAYGRFIDEACDLARRSTAAARIRRQGHAERPNWRELALSGQEQRRMDFLLSLDPARREMLAGLPEQERIGVVHDVLAQETFHGDFMARLADD